MRDVGVCWVAGPLPLTPGGSAQARLWLPAAQQGFKVTFLGDPPVGSRCRAGP